MKKLLFTTFMLPGFFVVYTGISSSLCAQERLTITKEAVAKAIHVQEKHTPDLMSIGGVVGTGVSFSQETGQVAIEIYVERQTLDLEALLPRVLEGIPVRMVETGKIYAR